MKSLKIAIGLVHFTAVGFYMACLEREDKQAHDLVEYLKSLWPVWFIRR